MDILPTKSFYILCLTVLFGIGCAEDDSRNTPMMDMSKPVDPGDMTPPKDVPDSDAHVRWGDPPVEPERCEGELPQPESGICDTVAGTGTGVLIRGTILGADGPIYGGTLLLDGNTIQCVGCNCADHPAFAEATRIECGHAVVSPGLINPHDHLTFAKGIPSTMALPEHPSA